MKTKTQIIAEVAKKNEISQDKVRAIFNDFLDEIVKAVKDEGGVNFIGFGSFTRAFKPEKEMNSFGAKKKIPAHYAVKFKAGKLFKNKVNEKA